MKVLFLSLLQLKSIINSNLSNFVAPVVGLLLLVALSKGIIKGVELIMDKGDDGTVRDGWIRLGTIAVVVGAVVALVQLIVSKISGINLNI